MNTNKETKVLMQAERTAIKKKRTGRSYVLSDFSFSFKNPPAHKNELKEVLVKYLYKDQTITYFFFAARHYDDETVIKMAEDKIQEMIDSDEILEYAKYYYKNELYY